MNPIRTATAIPLPKSSRTAKEIRHMPRTPLIRILDAGASIVILILTAVTAGATATLGA